MSEGLELKEHSLSDVEGYISLASVCLVAHSVLGTKYIFPKFMHKVRATGEEFIHCDQGG